MAWIDIVVGALFGLVVALLLSRMFLAKPKTTVAFVLVFTLMGIMISDDFFTPSDKSWNIVDKIKNLITHSSSER